MVACDNQSTLKLDKNPVFHARTKHIEVHHHFVKERVLGGKINLDYIPTDQQPADIFTKPLSRIKFEQHRATLDLASLNIYFLHKTQLSRPMTYSPNILQQPHKF
jgi:hypothetical protein